MQRLPEMRKSGEPSAHRTATRLIHADSEVEPQARAVAPSIHQSATFEARDADDFAEMASTPRHREYYSRYGNPTLARAETVIAALEDAETALVTASGMGAISTAALALTAAGDHVIAQTNHYMGTTKLVTELLARFGIEHTMVDQRSPEAFREALRPNTRLIFMESPANPTLALTDIAAVASLARQAGALTMVDNTFASPINQRPLTLGADLVVHSGTKFLGGHHDLTAGVLAGSAALIDRIWNTSIVTGSVLGPFDAWLLLRGLRTLDLRIERHNRNGMAVARFLSTHPKVEAVHHPGLESHPQHQLALRQMTGFGGMLSFEVAGGYRSAQRVMAGLRIPAHAVSLGGVSSLAIHAASMWRGTLGEQAAIAAGAQPGLIRYSAGLEAAEDLIADLEQALARA